MDPVQAEDKVKVPCLKWFREQLGYLEKYADNNGGGGAMADSIGILTGTKRLIVIEFKYRITPSTVDGPAIEKKVRDTFSRIYGGGLVCEWNREMPPLLYIIAGSITDEGARALARMLDRQSAVFKFSYDYGTFKSSYDSLGAKATMFCLPEDLKSLKALAIPWKKTNRKPKLSIHEFLEIAKKQDVLELIQRFMDHAEKHAGVITANRSNFNYSFRAQDEGRNVVVFGVWPSESAKSKGLCVSYHPERLGKCFGMSPDKIGEIPGPVPHGRIFDSPKKFLRNTSEVDSFWFYITTGGLGPN